MPDSRHVTKPPKHFNMEVSESFRSVPSDTFITGNCTTRLRPLPHDINGPASLTSILRASQAMARTSAKAKHSTGGNAAHRPLARAQGSGRVNQTAAGQSSTNNVELASQESQRPQRRSASAELNGSQRLQPTSLTAGPIESQDTDSSEVRPRTNDFL